MDDFDVSIYEDILDGRNGMYFSSSKGLGLYNGLKSSLCDSDVYFVKMKSITFEGECPPKQALENVLSSVRLPWVNFHYLIKGNSDEVSFYYGISKDLVQYNDNEPVDVFALGESILKKSIEGNFRGSVIDVVSDEEKHSILKEISRYQYISSVEGVPGECNDSSEFQRVERLVDVLLGDDFAFLITAKYVTFEILQELEKNVCSFYDNIVPHVHSSIQVSESEGTSSSHAQSHGTSVSNGRTTQHTDQRSHSQSENKSGTSYDHKTQGNTIGDTTGYSDTTGDNESSSSNESETDTNGINTSSSKTQSVENKRLFFQNWQKYIEETINKRLDYGKGKGVFSTTITILTSDLMVKNKIENTVTSIFSGDSGNMVPLRCFNIEEDKRRLFSIRNLQIPIANFSKPVSMAEIEARTVMSQYLTEKKIILGNWYSVKELSIIAGIPRKEVVGLSLSEEVEFGLNVAKCDKSDEIKIGKLVQSGIQRDGIDVAIKKSDLAKHVFICGVTGSGKTTTCMSLIEQSKLPFLVIEPAKTEYRILANNNPELLVFTLGRDNVAPFRINPLEFLETETISSHIDMIKATIEAAFDMEAAIPQIIETSLYRCYEDFGWDIRTSKNNDFPDPFKKGVYSFPTLSDLIHTVENVVNDQGFDDRLKNDYLASIKARLMGLTVGAKGEMLNTPRSLDFRGLVHRKVVLELDDIKSGSEKSLIMGFILSQLCESIKHEFNIDRRFKHISLVEEAHRLLSKYEPGDSLNKKNGVEVFSDMLAEMRKYGECLIVADQIPNKMAPEVLKNTSTKIVHKIFALDDKTAIGNTMSLSEEQMNFLSKLPIGRAVIFSNGWNKSILVQVNKLWDTTNGLILEDKLRKNALAYFSENYNDGVFPELAIMEGRPSENLTNWILMNKSQFVLFAKSFMDILSRPRSNNARISFQNSVTKLRGNITYHSLAIYLNSVCFVTPNEESKFEIESLLKESCTSGFLADDFDFSKYILINNKQKKLLC